MRRLTRWPSSARSSFASTVPTRHARRFSRSAPRPCYGRRLQEDALLDTEDELLRRQRSTLRVRSEGGKSLLTFKGPALPGLIKIREEYETVVADGAALLTILEALGLHVWFRYEKYREEFSGGRCGDRRSTRRRSACSSRSKAAKTPFNATARALGKHARRLHHRFVPLPVPAASRRERPRRARHGVRRPARNSSPARRWAAPANDRSAGLARRWC